MKEITLEEYTEALKVVRAYIAQIQEEIGEKQYTGLANEKIMRLDIYPRLKNALRGTCIDFDKPHEYWPTLIPVAWTDARVYHLFDIPPSEFKRVRELGKKSQVELENLIRKAQND